MSLGWILSACHANDAGHTYEDQEFTEDQLQQADLLGHTPLSSQHEVDEEARKRAAKWNVGAHHDPIRWPDMAGSLASLLEISVDILKDAALTFPIGTGLGWHKLHPRAVLRCSAAALLILAKILILAETIGCWPDEIGITVICLPPKPDGGRRPIGLLPSVIRWWMRARLDVARA